jgi:UDP-N-acetyl-2-amino-2-deoxyglucuronate dehydrogenase
METEDYAACAVRYASGALGVIEATTANYPGDAESIEFIGTERQCRVVGLRLYRALPRRQSRRDVFPAAGKLWRRRRSDGLPARSAPRGVDRFPRRGREQHRAPRVTAREALKVHHLIDAMLEAGRSGMNVKVRE